MKQIHIYAYGDVCNFQGTEAADYGIICLKNIVDQISANPDAEEIIVHIHSGGGDCYEGFAIHDALKNSGKKITTIIEGLCASIATVIALAGSKRQMTKNSEFMIHNPWSFGMGTADELEKQAEYVRSAEDKLANFYVEKTGQKLDDIKNMMTDETFMTPDKAKELGFITDVLEEASAKKNFKVYATIKNKNTKPMKKDEKKNDKKVIDKKSILNKLVAMLNDVVDDKEDVKAALELKTKDGKTVTITTDAEQPAIGDAVMVDGASAPDATLEMEDGSVIETDADSNIEAIETSEEEIAEETGTDAAAKAKIEKLEKELKAANKIATDLQKKLDDETAITAQINEKLTLLAKTIKSNHKPDDEPTRFRKTGKEEVKDEAAGSTASTSYKEKALARRFPKKD